MTYTTTTPNDINCCDKCGRSVSGKGWIEIQGMKICGICQYETKQKSDIEWGAFEEWNNEDDGYWNSYLA